MLNAVLTQYLAPKLVKDLPDFKAGDTVQVNIKIREGDKERLQPFTGVVIQRRHGQGIDATFTISKTGADGVSVEKIFPLHSPAIEKIKVLKKGKVSRARLFYLRELSGKSARITEKQ
jgi:large subunit ribosomal protein L19